MSFEPQPLPRSASAVPEGLPNLPSGTAKPAIRRQAEEIIESVLSGSNPEQAGIRELMRQCLAAHPGHPEAAVLEHLMNIRDVEGVSGRARGAGLETGTPDAASVVRSRVEAVLKGKLLVTAFQPILDLASGRIVGAEALTRFLGEGGDNAEHWFNDAKYAQLAGDLEFAALESALAAAGELPDHLYVGLKLSPSTCLDPLLPVLLEESALDPGRIVLELTEALTREQPAPIVAALAPLRREGLRLAVNSAGSFFISIRPIAQIRPDIIKLDRNVIAGIDTDTLRVSLGEAMVMFAGQIGAMVIAHGIETPEELAIVTGLGIAEAQGYLLGRPTTRPADWKEWNIAARQPIRP